VARDKIHARNHLVGSGQMNHPDRLEELELRRAQHERATRGKPAKPFKDLLDEKMKKQRQKDQGGQGEENKDDADDKQKGAIDPHMGLQVAQKPSIANKSGRRSGKVIVKG
jgi:hypothetical protein